MGSQRILGYVTSATIDGDNVQAFGVTRTGAEKNFALALEWLNKPAREARYAETMPILPGALVNGEPLLGYEDLPEAGGKGLARARKRRRR